MLPFDIRHIVVCHVQKKLFTTKNSPVFLAHPVDSHGPRSPFFPIFRLVRYKVAMYSKGKGLDTCYSAIFMSQTRDQQRFTISELAVAADWYEPIRHHWANGAAAHYVAIHCPR